MVLNCLEQIELNNFNIYDLSFEIDNINLIKNLNKDTDKLDNLINNNNIKNIVSDCLDQMELNNFNIYDLSSEIDNINLIKKLQN